MPSVNYNRKNLISKTETPDCEYVDRMFVDFDSNRGGN